MRLIAAAVVFFLGLFVITSLITAVLPANAPEWLSGVAILVGFVCSLVLTNKLVNRPGTRFLGRPHAAETPEQLAQDGMLTAVPYRARRAFLVEELEDEGPHYFIELLEGSVLYLNGRYLHEHEPLEFDNKIVHQRGFPCSEFIIRRRSDDGTAVDIQCSGSVFEPEVVTASDDEGDFRGKNVLKDGDIITGKTYDEVKAARSGRAAAG